MPAERSSSNVLLLVLLGAFYAIFGAVTWLNGVLIPYLKIACELTLEQALLVTFAFYIAYTVMALPSSWVLKRTGFKGGMVLGLSVMALGALLFIPAANSRTYELFLTGLFVIGTGLTLLQTAVNPYVTIIGPLESAAKRMSIMGICNKVAGVLGPIALASIVLKDADAFVQGLAELDPAQRALELDGLASRVILPYGVMAAVLVVLAIAVWRSPLPEIADEAEATHADATSDARGIFTFPHLVLGVIALFLYVGVEVIAGDTIATYGQSQGIPLDRSKYFPAFTLTAMVVGYLIGIATIPRVLSQAKALLWSALAGIAISLLVVFTHGYASVLAIALLGLANALMWPAIWPLAIEGLGRHTKTASALLIMAIAGGALLPKVYGMLVGTHDAPLLGDRAAYWMLVPCYVFIAWYAMQGHRLRRWS
ncbi:MAG: sugar MFS transporter [Flavobacteriales bacterium]|nr:sugar MFS transporter [Flavobacteriales bacterium]MBK9539338.1 sugar MFS transporter [Flavobacteriales bacterium]